MSEFYKPPYSSIEKLNSIGYDALTEVAARYGYGYEEVDRDCSPDVRHLAYHNAQHSLRVRGAARQLAQLHHLSTFDEELVVTIASAHDLFHDGIDDEERSADWLTERLAIGGFSEEDQEIARLAVLGTTPIKDSDGEYVSQQFSLTQFPSERAREVALCVAASDMEAIFAPHGPLVAHDLFRESNDIHESLQDLDISQLISFQARQIHFVESFHPLYPELEQIFGGLRKEIVDHHKLLLGHLQSGEIRTWQEIYRSDIEFCERHSTS